MRTPTKTLLWSALATLFCATPGFAENVRIAWDPNPEPTVTGYRVSYGTAPGSHPTTVDVGNQTSALLPSLPPGQRYYFVVTAYSANAVSPPSVEVSAVPLAVVALSSNALSSPMPTGASVTWTALASAATQTLEYQFSRLNQATGAYTIVQPYGPSKSFTWTPAAGEEGTYAMRVWVRVTGSTDPFDARRETAPFTIANTSLVIGSLEADAALPAPTGAPITFKAKASGGPAPLQYRFYRLNRQTNIWTMVRDYSTVDNYTWTPAATDEGSYSVQVWVRRAGSTAAYDLFRTSDAFSIMNVAPAVADFRTTTPLPAGTGTPITWKVSAGGGPGPLQYRFYRLNRATNIWTMVQDFGPSSSYSWTPAAGEVGTYALQVWVKRPGATGAYEAWSSTPDFAITDALPVIRSVTSDAGAPIGADAPVKFTADATGGPGPLQYGFSLYSVAKDAWSVAQGYTANNAFSWLPGSWDAGSYTLQTSVMRPGGQTAEAVSANSFDVAASSTPAILSITRATGPTLNPGMPIVWTVKAAGGGAPLEYLFARYNAATQVWTTVQAYSWDNSYGWVPMANEKGTYLLAAFIRRTGNTAAYEQVAYSGTFIVN